MARKEVCKGDKVRDVLQILRRRGIPFTRKQEKFYSRDCVERFLKARGGNVKKAARQLRSCTSWRESTGIEIMDAEEFSVEISEGLAYVAGFDEESRPVMIFRSKPAEFQKFHWHKSFIRLFIFTLEVAIGIMTKKVQEFVLIFDAKLFRSTSAFLNMMLLPALKIVADYYPSRLFKAFVVDPPSIFSYIWKGVRPFVELSPATAVVCSSAAEEAISPPYSSSSSSRFTFAISHHHSDTLKPWYLTTSKTTPCSLSRRSFSAASGGDISPPPRTPSFLESPAMICSRSGRWKEKKTAAAGAFVAYVSLFRRQYDEVTYRSMMRRHVSSSVQPYMRER